MNKLVTTMAVIIIAAAAAVGYFYHQRSISENRPVTYEFVSVSRGNIESIIISSGTLSPVGTVEVGTQVSGTVDKVMADFNDIVRAGQIIAEIDRSVLISRLSETEASLARAEALFVQSEQELKRGESLFEKGLISEQEFLRLRTDFHTQRASLQVAKAAVTTAQENVRYATIRSPVSGTVISRNVEVGQTVAASLSAPTLFIIAEDLRQMKIMAQVDETDIGRIRESQNVRFSVQAYPNKTYYGKVSQVRLQPEVVQNVVTYTVVVIANNTDGTLLPGMTANVIFVEAKEENALTVPMAALRFKPPEDVIKKFEEDVRPIDGKHKTLMTDEGTDIPNNTGMSVPEHKTAKRGNDERTHPTNSKARMRGGSGERVQKNREGGDGRKRGGGLESGGRAVLWTLNEAGEFLPVHVRLGLNDGIRSAVVGKDDLQEGLRVVSGEAKSDKASDKKKNDEKRQQRSIIPQAGQSGQRRI